MRIDAGTLGLLTILGLTGCANVSIERAKVEKIDTITVVRVQTPTMQIPTIMQAYVGNSQGAGLLAAAIAESQDKAVVSPQSIPDVGVLLADGLRSRLPRQASWWPRMVPREDPVAQDYIHPDGAWLRLEIRRFEIAPPPLRTVSLGVEVSLRNANNEPLWTQLGGYKGIRENGERIDVDRVAAGDLSQLRREIARAVRTTLDQIFSSIP